MTHCLKLIKQLVAIASLSAASVSALAAINLAADPSSQTIGVGGAVTVGIKIDGLGVGAAPSVGTYDLDLAFDSSVLNFVSATFGDSVLGNQLDLFGLGNVASVTPSPGTVNLFELSQDTASDLNSLQADSFVFATIHFSGLAVGISPINITLNALGDADGVALLANTSSGLVQVTAVPAPAAYLLLLAGIGMISGARIHKSGLRGVYPVVLAAGSAVAAGRALRWPALASIST